jgi:predicted dehydrogenase
VTAPRILVLGAGSIGARHAGNLAAAGATVFISDPQADRAGSVPGATAVPFDPSAMGGYDGVVVASPTSLHAEHALEAAAQVERVLVEKPLAATSREADSVAAQVGDRVMVGYNLRLHAPLERVMELAHGGSVGRILGVRLWFGSYLPDWRPATDYRASYSAQAALGGGVLLDAIHELDMLLWLLDDRLEVAGAIVARAGDLEIDVEDTVKAVLRHADGAVVDISLDYVSRRYRRGIEVIGDAATVRLDWARNVLEVEDGSSVVTHDVSADVSRSYEREARTFLDWVAGRSAPPVDAVTGAKSVRLADEIRRAAG